MPHCLVYHALGQQCWKSDPVISSGSPYKLRAVKKNKKIPQNVSMVQKRIGNLLYIGKYTTVSTIIFYAIIYLYLIQLSYIAINWFISGHYQVLHRHIFLTLVAVFSMTSMT